MFTKMIFVPLVLFAMPAMAEDGFILKNFEVTQLELTCESLGRYTAALEVKLENGQSLELLNYDGWTFRYFAPGTCATAVATLYREALAVARSCAKLDLIARDLPGARRDGFVRLDGLEVVAGSACGPRNFN